MTLVQAFIFKTRSEVSQAEASLALEFAGLNPNADYISLGSGDRCKFFTAVANYISQDNVGVKSVSEGGYSIVYDADLKANFLKQLADESGCANLISKYNNKPKVKDRSSLW